MRPRITPRRPRPHVAALLACTLACALAAPRAGAQIIRVTGPREPAFWASAGAGYVQPGGDVRDGRTQSVWRFGNGVQYRAGFEKGVGNESSLGLTVTHGRLPLTYYDLSTISVPPPVLEGTPPAPDCHGGCDAHADVESLGASFHAGGGIGIHQVIEVTAGATRYANFRADAGDATLAPASNTDASLAVGYGFGFPLGRSAELTLVQDAAAVLHERTGLRGGQSSLTQFYTTRIGVRLGLGARRPGV